MIDHVIWCLNKRIINYHVFIQLAVVLVHVFLRVRRIVCVCRSQPFPANAEVDFNNNISLSFSN